MKRKTLVIIHITATIKAACTIALFFLSSLIAELMSDEEIIRTVKASIFYSLPVLFFSMPTLAISGRKLAGHSQHPDILKKMARMKLMVFNGIILIALASFLYYYSNYYAIDSTFLYAQIVELILGFTNLLLIGLNIQDGLKLSGRFCMIS